jgi:threonine dehydrogenase-like Zn-dependent dehydrogenase
LSLRDYPKPEVKPGWVLVDVKALGICGTDLHYFLGFGRELINDDALPFPFGHESAGVVAEVGEGVEGIKVGDRVVGEPVHACPELEIEPPCPACETGDYEICINHSTVGIPFGECLTGGYGRYAAFHQSRIFHLPENLTFQEAITAEPLTCAVHGVNVAQPALGDTVAVVGAGVVGLETIQCLNAAGATRIIAVAKYPFQAEVAKQVGATDVVCLEDTSNLVAAVKEISGSWGPDQVYECVGGESDALQQSLDICCRGGKVVLLGVFSGVRPINLLSWLVKEVTVIPVNAYSRTGYHRHFQTSLDLLASGKLQAKPLLTHVFDIEGWEAGLEAAYDKKTSRMIKGVFVRS